MRHTGKTFLLLMTTLVAAPFSFASTVTWNLNNVAFSDNATASGSFDLNADTNAVSNWNISVTAGVLSAFTYTPSNSTAGSYFQVPGYENELLFMMNGTTRQLRLTPLTTLTNAGGSVPINLNTFGNGSGSVECFNCAPYREVVGGTLMTGTPEPAAVSLLGIGVAALGLVARKRRVAA